jgi:hypothetical protein
LYVLQASAQFIAPHEPLQKGHVITMDKKCLTLKANQIDSPILYKAFFDAQDCLYWLNATIMHDPTQVNKEPSGGQWLMTNGSSASTSNYDLWHKCFGHPGKKSIEELRGKVKGVPDCITAPANPKPCDGCEFGKSKHAAFPSLESRTEHPLDLIHMDLVEYPVQSIDGYCYTLTTLNDHFSFDLTWFLKYKSDILAAFKQFVSWAERQFKKRSVTHQLLLLLWYQITKEESSWQSILPMITDLNTWIYTITLSKNM